MVICMIGLITHRLTVPEITLQQAFGYLDFQRLRPNMTLNVGFCPNVEEKPKSETLLNYVHSLAAVPQIIMRTGCYWTKLELTKTHWTSSMPSHSIGSLRDIF